MTEHEHEFLFGFVRRMSDGSDYVIFAGERPTDRYVEICDCGEEGEEKPNPMLREQADGEGV